MLEAINSGGTRDCPSITSSRDFKKVSAAKFGPDVMGTSGDVWRTTIFGQLRPIFARHLSPPAAKLAARLLRIGVDRQIRETEGTALDPLLNTTYNLNRPKVVPFLKDVAR